MRYMDLASGGFYELDFISARPAYLVSTPKAVSSHQISDGGAVMCDRSLMIHLCHPLVIQSLHGPSIFHQNIRL